MGSAPAGLVGVHCALGVRGWEGLGPLHPENPHCLVWKRVGRRPQSQARMCRWRRSSRHGPKGTETVSGPASEDLEDTEPAQLRPRQPSPWERGPESRTRNPRGHGAHGVEGSSGAPHMDEPAIHQSRTQNTRWRRQQQGPPVPGPPEQGGGHGAPTF